MGWAAAAYLVGIALNYGTLLAHGGMPVPFNGPTGYRLDGRHVIGSALFGDNLTFIPGWYISIGDVLVVGGCVVLNVATITYLIGRARARKTGSTPVVD